MPDSPLERDGFELVWGFPCQVVFFGLLPDEARGIVSRLHAITPAVMELGTRYRDPELRELFLSGLRLAASEAS